MSDFDFDELDKAVAGVTSFNTDQPEVKNNVPVEASSTAEVTKEEPTPEKTEAQKVVPAARRSAGRFMDVVHPSSDMRSRTSPAVVEPAQSSSSFEKPSFVPPVAKVEETSEPQETPFEEMSDIIDDATVGEWSKPQETPFLTGAKVEKRPLGGVGPEPTQELLEAPEEELLLEATLPDPIDFAAHMEALASESEDTGSPAPVEEEAEEQTIEQLDELIEPEPSTPPALEVKTPEEPVGPTSISQQYTEQPSEQKESGDIFDTENYHQPLTPQAPKKKSGAWTIIWILLLVILGAGAGVAFYLFVLPNL